MRYISRRGFAGLALGGLSTIGIPTRLLAETQCIAGNVPSFVPQRLQVSCASRKNFGLFRKYSDYVGLAGVVCRNTCNGPSGSYAAGTLILFPWLKPNAQAHRNGGLTSSLPTGGSSSKAANPIPGSTLPQDEYLCRILLQAPFQNFIGVLIDKPLSTNLPRADWYSDVRKLADGGAVGVDWTSANLNGPWFGGSRVIPGDDTCSGTAWRALIVDGLNQASANAC